MNWLKSKFHNWLFTYDYDIIIKQDATLPQRKYKNDAGYDLYVSVNTKIPAHSFANVPTGVFCNSRHVPAWILLTSRSSTLMRHGIMVDQGVIDGDYTGEMFIKAYNTTDDDVYLPPTTRIGQIIVIPHTNIKFRKVKMLKSTPRGNNGFGHTGI